MLVLPEHYQTMSNDDMLYTEGGYRTTRTVWVPRQTIRISRNSYAHSLDLANLIINAGLTYFSGGSVPIMIKTLEVIGSTWFGHSGSMALAKEADRSDGKYDGWITRTIPAHHYVESNPFPPNSYAGATF